MRTPLLISAVGFSLLFVALHLKAMRNEILRRRVKALQLAEVERAQAGRLAAAE
jgi:heme exporter protein C